MAFTYGFYNSMGHDRKYNAEQMSTIFDGLIKDGVFDSIGELFAVSPVSGMRITVGSGRAWFNHTWSYNDSDLPLTVEPADVTLNRYDAVVLEIDSSDAVRANKIKIIKGNPGSTPVKPVMADTPTLHQHPLAYIYVATGATTIAKSAIQVVVGLAECPFVTGIIDTASIDSLFSQWDGQFNEWFDNLKEQLSDNVVANLQKQIDDRVKITDKATTAQAIAGTDDTKWMSPKKTKDLLGTAAQTVLDKETGKLVSINSQIKYIGLSPLTIGFNKNDAIGSSGAHTTSFCLNQNVNKLFFTYMEAGVEKMGYVLTTNLSENTKPIFLGNFLKANSTTPLGIRGTSMSMDGSVIHIGSHLVDTINNRLSPPINLRTSNYSAGNSFATGDRWGYIEYNNEDYYTSMYVTSRVTTEPWAELSLPRLSFGVYHTFIGIRDNDLFYIRNDSYVNCTLNKINVRDKSLTSNMKNFSLASKGWSSMTLTTLFYDTVFAYILIRATKNSQDGICPQLLKINLSDGSSNWETLADPVPNLLETFPGMQQSEYIGAVDGLNYCYSFNNGINVGTIFSVNKATGYITMMSAKFLSKSPSYSYNGGSKLERSVAISELPNVVPYEAQLINVKTGIVTPMYYEAHMGTDNSTNDYELRTAPPLLGWGRLRFAGNTVTNAKLLSATEQHYNKNINGVDTSQFTLIGGDIVRDATVIS